MQTIDFWNKRYLHRSKIVIGVLFILVSLDCMGQTGAEGTRITRGKRVAKNNPNYDQRKLSYGFQIGLHTSMYQLKYSDRFVTEAFDTVHSINSRWKPGFALGFLVNYRITEYLDLRTTPTVGFYEHEVTYLYTDETKTNTRVVENTMVEFPVLLKYKSERRGNVRMYVIGGIKPAIEAAGKKEQGATLEVTTTNLSLDLGWGFDLYYPLFKFSPEIRFSRGMVDILENRSNTFGQPLKRVNTNTITIYFVFQ